MVRIRHVETIAVPKCRAVEHRMKRGAAVRQAGCARTYRLYQFGPGFEALSERAGGVGISDVAGAGELEYAARSVLHESRDDARHEIDRYGRERHVIEGLDWSAASEVPHPVSNQRHGRRHHFAQSQDGDRGAFSHLGTQRRLDPRFLAAIFADGREKSPNPPDVIGKCDPKSCPEEINRDRRDVLALTLWRRLRENARQFVAQFRAFRGSICESRERAEKTRD